MIEVEGMEEAQAYLAKLKARLSDDRTWTGPLKRFGVVAVQFARSISPVVTGSYQASHRAAVERKTLTISIDPAARNTVSGTLVTRYAGPVEKRHQVYARTAEHLIRVVTSLLDDLVKESKL